MAVNLKSLYKNQVWMDGIIRVYTNTSTKTIEFPKDKIVECKSLDDMDMVDIVDTGKYIDFPVVQAIVSVSLEYFACAFQGAMSKMNELVEFKAEPERSLSNEKKLILIINLIDVESESLDFVLKVLHGYDFLDIIKTMTLVQLKNLVKICDMIGYCFLLQKCIECVEASMLVSNEKPLKEMWRNKINMALDYFKSLKEDNGTPFTSSVEVKTMFDDVAIMFLAQSSHLWCNELYLSSKASSILTLDDCLKIVINKHFVNVSTNFSYWMVKTWPILQIPGTGIMFHDMKIPDLDVTLHRELLFRVDKDWSKHLEAYKNVRQKVVCVLDSKSYPVLAKLLTYKFDDFCACCLRSLDTSCRHCDDNDKCVLFVGKCGHVYHDECISRWLTRKKCCPLDDAEFELELQLPLAL